MGIKTFPDLIQSVCNIVCDIHGMAQLYRDFEKRHMTYDVENRLAQKVYIFGFFLLK